MISKRICCYTLSSASSSYGSLVGTLETDTFLFPAKNNINNTGAAVGELTD